MKSYLLHQLVLQPVVVGSKAPFGSAETGAAWEMRVFCRSLVASDGLSGRGSAAHFMAFHFVGALSSCHAPPHRNKVSNRCGTASEHLNPPLALLLDQTSVMRDPVQVVVSSESLLHVCISDGFTTSSCFFH